MPAKLQKSAVSVQETLNRLKLECKVLELPGSTRTAVDAASSVGCEVAQIVKSLIFKAVKTGKPILALVSGANQVDLKSLARHLGEDVTKADADFAREITGFAIGGIPPIGHKNSIEFIYVDEDLLNFSEVWAAAGTPNAVFCIKSKDLLEITEGKLVNIKGG